MVKRSRAPGVAVAPGIGRRAFRKGREAELEHRLPLLQHRFEAGIVAGSVHRFEQVEGEVERAAGQAGVLRQRGGKLRSQAAVRGAGENRPGVDVTTEVRLSRHVGVAAAFLVEAVPVDRGENALPLRFPVVSGDDPGCPEKPPGHPARFGVEQIQQRFRELFAAGAAPVRPPRGPVAEVPARHRPDQAGAAVAVRGEIFEHVADAVPVFGNDGLVAGVVVTVPGHHDPVEAETRDDLPEIRRVARGGQAAAEPRFVELPDRLPAEPRVAGRKIGDQRLNARVARVLQLLPVRAILVVLMGAAARRVPGRFEDSFEDGAFRAFLQPRVLL